MVTIKKKTWPEYFEEVLSGKKKFDLRLNDFKLKEGDTLLLQEWDPRTKEYTGREIGKKVINIHTFGLNDFGQEKEIKEKGFLIISLED
ncbi:MAG: DUF3850 domain-containing protein [Patescibacteria group bacterium]